MFPSGSYSSSLISPMIQCSMAVKYFLESQGYQDSYGRLPKE